MKEFIKYLSHRVFVKPDQLFYNDKIIQKALTLTLADVNYHYKNVTQEEVIDRIITHQNELIIFLYRFGNIIYKTDSSSVSLKAIHFIMKDLCSCEIYYSVDIGEGFYVFHGQGTAIGSRNKIGKGFRIFQNCSIGHRNSENASGNIIGDGVTCYAGSKILGENKIGDNVIIGANTVVTKDIPANKVAYGYPLTIKEIKSTTNTV